MRTYDDYMKALGKTFAEYEVVEMDTVKGVRGRGKRLLTMIFRKFRTSLFYCDPMASWQKPHIEKNHEYIRYVVPKGKSFTPYQQEDITLLMNHINSTKRASLKGKAPYELVDDDDEDMKALMDLLKMHLIPADEVHLTPDLFM